MMKSAGLEQYIPEDNTIAHWSTETFDEIFQALKESITDENTFTFMMYGANNQGDSHIMTLLRSHGGKLYDDEGNSMSIHRKASRHCSGSKIWTSEVSHRRALRTWNCWTASIYSIMDSLPAVWVI